MIKQWKNQLHELDSKTNQLKTLQKLEESFITSDYADCKQSRISAFLLLKHLKKLFAS